MRIIIPNTVYSVELNETVKKNHTLNHNKILYNTPRPTQGTDSEKKSKTDAYNRSKTVWDNVRPL